MNNKNVFTIFQYKDGKYKEDYHYEEYNYNDCFVYYKNNQVYKVEFIRPGGDIVWQIKNGQIHNESGPAITGFKYKRWFLNGEYIPVKSQKEFERYLLLQPFK